MISRSPICATAACPAVPTPASQTIRTPTIPSRTETSATSSNTKPARRKESLDAAAFLHASAFGRALRRPHPAEESHGFRCKRAGVRRRSRLRLQPAENAGHAANISEDRQQGGVGGAPRADTPAGAGLLRALPAAA